MPAASSGEGGRTPQYRVDDEEPCWAEAVPPAPRHLYLTDKLEDEVFTDVDDELAIALAAAAGTASDKARLHGEVPFDGTVDTSTSPEVTGHLLAMAGEALTNVARHPRSTTVEVMVHTPWGMVDIP